MTYLLSALAGLIQGVTEFLPISSSGHLVLFHDIFGFNLPDNLFFDVVLHWGTLLALLLFFYKDIGQIIRGFFSSLKKWNFKGDINQRLAWLIIIGTIPAVAVGYFFADFLNGARAPLVVAIALIAVAFLFWLLEIISKKQKAIGQIGKLDSIIIGCAQAVALVPGVSRSGITIIAGLARDMKREDAARFSFLLSIPAVFGAGVKEFFSLSASAGVPSPAGVDFWPLILGLVVAVITGYLAIKFLLNYLNNHSLNIFAWYRLIIGCLILIWFFWR